MVLMLAALARPTVDPWSLKWALERLQPLAAVVCGQRQQSEGAQVPAGVQHAACWQTRHRSKLPHGLNRRAPGTCCASMNCHALARIRRPGARRPTRAQALQAIGGRDVGTFFPSHAEQTRLGMSMLVVSLGLRRMTTRRHRPMDAWTGRTATLSVTSLMRLSCEWLAIQPRVRVLWVQS